MNIFGPPRKKETKVLEQVLISPTAVFKQAKVKIKERSTWPKEPK